MIAMGCIRDGVLGGNLIARFSGDPTFKRQSLPHMVEILKNRVSYRITSNAVLVDTSVFTSVFAGYGKGPVGRGTP
jgi:D-alanyl-D-alanine carboxypeptidase/D-alanyl-D-alanine-endopeptidase (penicillin-binding protein 4)